MPEKASSEYRGEAAAAAFEKVLQAEQAAEMAVEACRTQAAEVLSEAQAARRRLNEDVEARIAAWGTLLASKADARVAALERETARYGAPVPLDAALADRMELAVQQLANELIDGS